MKPASVVAKLPVVGIDEGEQIAVAKHLLVGRQSKKVEYISVELNVPSLMPYLLPYADVISVGKDYIVTQSAENIRKIADSDELMSSVDDYIFLAGTVMLSSDGDIVGKVVDFTIDENTGEIESLSTENAMEIEGRKLSTLSAKFIMADIGDAEIPQASAQNEAVAPDEAADSAESLQQDAEDSDDEEDDEDDGITYLYLMGKQVKNDITSDDGEFFIAEGTELTQDIINEAEKHDALLLLTMGV